MRKKRERYINRHKVGRRGSGDELGHRDFIFWESMKVGREGGKLKIGERIERTKITERERERERERGEKLLSVKMRNKGD